MQWNITDPDTKETVMVDGDTAPTADDAQEIFDNYYASKDTQQKSASVAPEQTYQGGWLSAPKDVAGKTIGAE
jgi:hypothetical protein